MKNIWGWKLSFVGLGVIVLTAIAVKVLDVKGPEEIAPEQDVLADSLNPAGADIYSDPYYTMTDPNMPLPQRVRVDFIRNCLNGAGPIKDKYPKLTRKNCECMADTVFTHYTIEQFAQIVRLPADSQAVIFRPLIFPCQTAFADAVEVIELEKGNISEDMLPDSVVVGVKE
jgi:hypothetical protein